MQINVKCHAHNRHELGGFVDRKLYYYCAGHISCLRIYTIGVDSTSRRNLRPTSAHQKKTITIATQFRFWKNYVNFELTANSWVIPAHCWRWLDCCWTTSASAIIHSGLFRSVNWILIADNIKSMQHHQFCFAHSARQIAMFDRIRCSLAHNNLYCFNVFWAVCDFIESGRSVHIYFPQSHAISNNLGAWNRCHTRSCTHIHTQTPIANTILLCNKWNCYMTNKNKWDAQILHCLIV